LQAHPDITAIFGQCGNNATGAIQAIENAGKVPGRDILVIGFDGTELELEAIAAGRELLSVSQDFAGIGARAVAAAVEALAGRTVEKTTYVPARLITKDNVGDFQ
jgi:ribose transport system substrate-binding protein